MNCTRCYGKIDTKKGYHRTRHGAHHLMGKCDGPIDRQIEVNGEVLALEWWRKDGLYIDPDNGDVDWCDKRAELAQIAFIAGYKAGKS